MNTKFLDYDVVKSTKALCANVPENTLGAVLMIFPSKPPEYEVEFVDSKGESIAVLTVKESDLSLVQRDDQ